MKMTIWSGALFLVTATFVFGSVPASASTGGMIGGGGNIIASAPVTQRSSVSQARAMIEETYADVAPYLEMKRDEIASGFSVSPNFTKLFASPVDVVETVKRTRPKIRVLHPCYDSKHRAFDGTALVAHGRHVCLSAQRIAAKANAAEIGAQSLALYVHEYSELVGFTDGEASAIQREVLSDIWQRSELSDAH